MTGIASQELKALLAIAGALVVLARWAWLRRLARRAPAAADAPLPAPDARARVERVSTGALVVLAAVAVCNYYGFSTKLITEAKAFDGYDLMHYYLNAKYFDELGYIGLYDAIVIADSERKGNLRKWRITMLRDLDTSVRKTTATVYARADEIKRQFSQRRWRQFKSDFRFLQRTMKRKSQERMLNDHGYNGPPLLQAIAGPVTNMVPVERVKLLCHVETLLVLLMFFVVWRTFGTRRLAIAVLWFAVCFSSRWPGVGLGLFRLDWFVALVVACCLLVGVEPNDGEPMSRRQKARIIGAGLLIAWATMMRIFPAAWLFGLGARAVWQLATRRRLDRVFVPLLLTFVVSSAVLGTFAVRSVGMENVEEFAEDIQEHLQPMNLSQQRMGFGVALAWRGEWSGGFASQRAMHDKWRLVGELKPVRYGLALLALLLLGFTIRPLSADSPGGRTSAFDATALGLIPFYLLMIASHYYWVHRLTAVLHHASHDEDGSVDHTVALSMLLGIEAFSNLVDSGTHFRYAVTSLTSALLGLYCVWVIGTRLWRCRLPAPDPRPAEIAPAQAATDS